MINTDMRDSQGGVVATRNDFPTITLSPESGDQTDRLQNAIDACGAKGGGKLELQRGLFETGTLYLRSGVEMNLREGVVLQASPDCRRFPILEKRALRLTGDDHGVRAMIFGVGIRNAALTGPGEIRATAEGFRTFPVGDQTRPRGIHLENCENMRIEGLRLRDSCFWMVLLLGCRNILLSDLSIWNHAMPNSDGIDVVGSSDVRIQGCVIDTDDDGICLKSGTTHATRRVHVSNCRVFTHCNALKVGTETNSDVEDLIFEDCVLGASRHDSNLHFGSRHGLSGICLGMVDGGSLRRATFSRIKMSDFESPIFVKIGTRNRAIPGDGLPEVLNSARPEISDISMENVECGNAGSFGSMVVGLPDLPIHGVSLRQVQVEIVRSCKVPAMYLDVNTREKEYPDCRHFGPSPAWGLFAAYVENFFYEDCQFSWNQPDGRMKVSEIDCGRLP